MSKKIIWLTFILIFFGLAMISSAGIFESQRNFDSNYYYVFHQFLYGLLPGIAIFLIVLKVKYKFWAKFSLPFLLISIALMVMIFMPGFGLSLRGATRWLDFKYFSFQPAEILKLSFILYLAAWFSKNVGGKRRESAIPFLVILSFIALLLAAQPDLGTLGVIFATAIIMYFIAGAKFSKIIGIIAFVLLLAIILIQIIPHKFDRVLAYLNPDFDPRGIGYHVKQSILAIGSGGIFGVGFGKGIQKTGFLPEPVSDSIFSVIVEELGFIGAGAVLFLFGLLLVYMIKIIKKVNSPFAKLTVSGILSLILVQVLINISSVTGLLPFTGITLPFISYGGTSLVVLMAAMGMVARIAREVKS